MIRLFLPLCLLLLGAAPGGSDGVVRLAIDSEQRWVPFDLTPGNQIRFRLTLDGRLLTGILDTGVSYSVLARASPAADPARVLSGGSATAIGGAVAVGWLPTDRLAFGGLVRSGGGASVAALPAIATGSAQPVDMLIGRDVLAGTALDIDYANKRFRLLRSGRMPFTGASAPLAISPGRHVYESALAIDGRVLAPMVVDTGDGSAITLSALAWRRAAVAGVATTSAISFGLAGPIVSGLAIVPHVSLGDGDAHDVEVRIEPQGGFSQAIGVAGRIGSGFLQRYRVLLDPGAGRMVLSRNTAVDPPPLRSTSGLLLGLEQDRLRVLHVMRGGPAAAAGWAAGETICAIDGQPVAADYATSPMAAWSVGAPGTRVALTLCDGTRRGLTLAHFY
ncbi:hypothetical protein [Sphingomonas sp. CROZ-RG-20F-R02-07]|uniref:hypothetical protein n=1 Tax=Sphingomonas sp. CROZ-RG-20F-R02-07 TaxID=2914832 RepID=UPI001F575E3C|nr:hypothetical protein [Sphingomonas sp. CROZ-RG-20F-R02-07]